MEGPLVERVLTLAQNSSIMLSAEALYVIVNAFGMAKKDNLGNLVTEPTQLKKLYISHYKHRLRHRKIELDGNEMKRDFLYCLLNIAGCQVCCSQGRRKFNLKH